MTDILKSHPEGASKLDKLSKTAVPIDIKGTRRAVIEVPFFTPEKGWRLWARYMSK
jgi:hypothetical protein